MSEWMNWAPATSVDETRLVNWSESPDQAIPFADIYASGLVGLGGLLAAAVSSGQSVTQMTDFADAVRKALQLVPKDLR